MYKFWNSAALPIIKHVYLHVENKRRHPRNQSINQSVLLSPVREQPVPEDL